MTIKVLYHTGRKNELGDEIVVIEAKSDWDEKGWMICEEFRRTPLSPLQYTPRTFCADTMAFEDVIKVTKETYIW